MTTRKGTTTPTGQATTTPTGQAKPSAKARKANNLSPVPPKATEPLRDRPLRLAQYWRVVALLGDQMEESAIKWPDTITATRHRDEFYKALDGVLLLAKESWQSELTRNTLEVKQEDELNERRWFRRNGVSAKAQQNTPGNPAA